MTAITTEDFVLRLRQLLLERKTGQPSSSNTVSIGSRTGSDLLWQTAAAAVTSDTSVMNNAGSHFLTSSRPAVASAAVGQNNTISQAIFNVLQGIRPRQPTNNSQTFQVENVHQSDTLFVYRKDN